MVDTVETAVYRLRAEGAEQLANLKREIEQTVVVEEKFGNTTRMTEQSLQRRIATMDPAIKVQQQYRKELEYNKRLTEEGVGTEAQRTSHLQLATQRYNEHMAVLGRVKTANDNLTNSTKPARFELINMSRQIQDIGVSLAGGQSPFQVLIQQGTQIADIFAASNATVGSFFRTSIGWAATFLKSTTGIVTAIAAVGGAAIFAAMQFSRASTTIEQALEEQNRLLKEGKELLDKRTSAERQAQLQSKEQTQFETLRNQLDLQIKLNKAMEDAAKAAGGRSTTPTGGGMPEMGIAPSGVAPSGGPGFAAIAAAVGTLNAAIAKGEPGIRQFNAELGRIGQVHPELALVVQDLMKAGEEGLKLEFATQRARAMSDALKGIATDAQMAAVGLGSVAQFKFNNLQGEEAKAVAERQAQVGLQLLQIYQTQSVEAAKTLDALSGQLSVAQAVGNMAQIEAQHKTKIAELSQRMSDADATRIANAERAVALAQIESQHKQQMIALQGQFSVAQESTGIGQINAQYEATVALLTLQIGQAKALEQAELQRAIAIEQVNANADKMLKSLEEQGELIRASSEEEASRIRARQTYNNLIDQGVDKTKAEKVANEQLRNEEEKRNKAAMEAQDRALASIKTQEQAWDAYARRVISWSMAHDKAVELANATENINEAQAAMDRLVESTIELNRRFEQASTTFKNLPFYLLDALGVMDKLFNSNQGGKSQFNPDGYQIKELTPVALMGQNLYGPGGINDDGTPNAQGMEYAFNKTLQQSGGNIAGAVSGLLSGSFMTQGTLGSPSVLDTNKLNLLNRAIELLPQDQQTMAINRELGILKGMPTSLESGELIKSLTDKLEQLAQATQENTSATQSMTDVLSPLYSSDPRQTRIGFRAFAGGGIMTEHGALPLRHYAGGGIATSPQVAVFGEGSTPEAYIPAPNGAIPIAKIAGNDNKPTVITNNFYVQGNLDKKAAREITAFQQRQGARRMMATGG